MKVLVVDDEPQIRRALRTSLEAHGYEVATVGTGEEGVVAAADQQPDLVLLDLGLPDMDGTEVIRRVRGFSDVPVIILSVREAQSDKVAALDAGADDYVTKPFAVGELLARVRAALRHAVRSPSGGPGPLRFDDATVDLRTRTATRGGAEIRLTPIEYRLLACLAKHIGMVVTHRLLLTEVWGPAHAADTHYLRIYMKQLRDKLEADPSRPRHLLTETGVGYRLRELESDAKGS